MASRKAFDIFQQAAEAVIPAGALTVSEWADKYRYLSPEASAEPGRWRTSRVPYSAEWMNAFNDPTVTKVVLKTSSQVGKSETLNNVCGYFMHFDPCPIMFIQPTVDRMREYSKKRLAPMIRDTPALAATVGKEQSRVSDNTILSKDFIGGHLLMVGANAASGLASTPIRLLLADEIDRYPLDVEGEGSPLALAEVRQTTFTNKKTGVTSTPTIKGESAVEQEYEKSDKNRCFVPCPHCGEMQTLKMKQLVWEATEEGSVTAIHYACEVNGCAIEQHEKLAMLDGYNWIPERPHTGTVGFEINALYSPWFSWKEFAEDFIRASRDAKAGKPETLKTFVNTRLGETWDTKNEQADVQGLENRMEPYLTDVPLGVLLLTAGVDTQPNRLECSIWGWGPDGECWLIYHEILWGDTSKQQVWQELEELLSEEFTCERETADGVRLKRSIDAACIDAGGHNAEDVKSFTKRHRGRKWLAIFGKATGAKETIIKRPTRVNGGALLWAVGPNLIKDKIFAQLKVTDVGPGYVHFPTGMDGEYFKQLTAEKRVRKQKKFDPKDPFGHSQYMYKKIRERNEALDCMVYAFAAKDHINPSFPALLEKENLHCAKKGLTLYDTDSEKKESFTRKFQKNSGGWVSSWRK